MTDPKNHDDERDETASSGEPEDTDVEGTEDTDAETTEADESVEDAVDADEDDVDDDLDDVDDEPADDLDDETEDDEPADERRKDRPVAAGKASRSGNPARAAEAEKKTRSTRPVKPQKIGNRWAAPAMLACAAIGLLWIVLYYVFANRDNPIPLMSDLGDWNLIVGMAFIVAAFGFSMKWE